MKNLRSKLKRRRKNYKIGNRIPKIEIAYKKASLNIEPALRLNMYTCNSCGHQEYHIDIHSGTTPFQINCESCGGNSRSNFYNLSHLRKKVNEELAKRVPISFVNYFPPIEYFRKLTKAQKEHVIMEGIVPRSPNEDEMYFDYVLKEFVK